MRVILLWFRLFALGMACWVPMAQGSVLDGSAITVDAAGSSAYGMLFSAKPTLALKTSSGSFLTTAGTTYTRYDSDRWFGLLNLRVGSPTDKTVGGELFIRAQHGADVVETDLGGFLALDHARFGARGNWHPGSALLLSAEAAGEYTSQRGEGKLRGTWNFFPHSSLLLNAGGNTIGDGTMELGLSSLLTLNTTGTLWLTYSHMTPLTILNGLGGAVQFSWQLRPGQIGPTANVQASRLADRVGENPTLRHYIALKGSLPLLVKQAGISGGLTLDNVRFYTTTTLARTDTFAQGWASLEWRFFASHFRIYTKGEAIRHLSSVPSGNFQEWRLGGGFTASL